MAAEDQARKQKAVDVLNPQSGGGFGTPGALNSFLVAMVFFAPGSMKVDNAAQKIPGWLLSGYKDVFDKELPV